MKTSNFRMQILPINQASIRGPAMILLKLLLLQKAAGMRNILGGDNSPDKADAGRQGPHLYDEMLEMCLQVGPYFVSRSSAL